MAQCSGRAFASLKTGSSSDAIRVTRQVSMATTATSAQSATVTQRPAAMNQPR
jgi:hypothetical protein